MYAASRHDQLASLVAPRAGTRAPFSPLEERVLRLAASGSERPSTAVEPALRRFARRIGNMVMAHRGGRELADPRLEALRSYAASVRRGGYDGLAVFHAAGYNAAQARAVKAFVVEASRLPRRSARRDRIVYASGLSLGVASIAAVIAMTGTLLVSL